MKFFIIFCLCMVLIWASGSSAWPQFQGNFQHNGQTNIVLPNSITVKWSKNLETSISPYTSPIIGWANGEEIVYIGTAVGLYCLSSSTSDVIWFYPTPTPVIYTPIYQIDRLYFAVDDSLFCLNPQTGERIWAYGLDNQINGHLTIADDYLYLNAGDRLYAFNWLNCQFLWMTDDLGPGFDNSAPAVDDSGYIYVVTLGNSAQWYDYRLYKFDSTGSQIWMKEELYFESQGVRMTPTISPNGDIVFATPYGGYWTTSLYCYQPNGDLRWRKTDYDAIAFSSPAIDFNGNIYYGTCNSGHYLKCRDSLGNFQWSYGSLVKYSSPAVDGAGKIIVGATNGRLIILNPDGTLFYEYNCAGSITTSPAIAWDENKGAVYIATDGGKLYKFGFEIVAVEENKNKQINRVKCTPNPFTNLLNISLDGQDQAVKIYDISGREVFSGYGRQIVWQASAIPSGIYFVQIGDKQGRKIKVIKLK